MRLKRKDDGPGKGGVNRIATNDKKGQSSLTSIPYKAQRVFCCSCRSPPGLGPTPGPDRLAPPFPTSS